MYDAELYAEYAYHFDFEFTITGKRPALIEILALKPKSGLLPDDENSKKISRNIVSLVIGH